MVGTYGATLHTEMIAFSSKGEVVITRETKRPRDYEVMDEVLDRGDAVELARMLSVSPQLIRAWCRSPETEDEFATGKFGPLPGCVL